MDIIVVPPEDIPDDGFDPSPDPPSPSTPAPVTSPPASVSSPAPNDFIGGTSTACQVCDGAKYREDMAIPVPELAGATCESVILVAQNNVDATSGCLDLKYAEALCCPSVASTCSICQGAQLYDYLELPDYALTCGEFAFQVAEFDVASQDCTDFQRVEQICCPDAYDPPETVPPTSPPSVSSSPPTFYPTRCVFFLLLRFSASMKFHR
jgi:hypothetical protein